MPGHTGMESVRGEPEEEIHMPASTQDNEARAVHWQALRTSRLRTADVHAGLEADQDVLAHMLGEYQGLWQQLEQALEERLLVLTNAARSAA